MPDPITTIDLLHSGTSDNVATPWAETRRVLETAEVFWLSTVRADGRPHVTPVSSLWLDGTLYFSTGGIAQKTKHLRENPHVALTTGCNRLATGFDVVVEGDAVPFTDVAVLERLNQMWRTLWGEGWPIEFRNGVFYETSPQERAGEPLLVFAVTPTKIFAYTRGDQWSQTRYQF
jgi:general stress protein 26